MIDRWEEMEMAVLTNINKVDIITHMLDYDENVKSVQLKVIGGHEHITLYDKACGITQNNRVQLMDKLTNLCFNTDAKYVVSVPHYFPPELVFLVEKISEILDFKLEIYINHRLELNDEFVHIMYEYNDNIKQYTLLNRGVVIYMNGKQSDIIKQLFEMYKPISKNRRVQFIFDIIDPNYDLSDGFKDKIKSDLIDEFNNAKCLESNKGLNMILSAGTNTILWSR